MNVRFTPENVQSWRREGVALMRDFFTPEDVAAVRADFETVFGRVKGAEHPVVRGTGAGTFDDDQFASIHSIPLPCSPALNLIGVHPALIGFAQQALGTENVYLYQCQAWAKFTGDADYTQPFHCDFNNHTLTVPSEDARFNSVTFFCYFSDVTEAHGPMHYVTRPDSAPIAGPETTLRHDPQFQAELRRRLQPFERSTAAPAGSVIAYGIDVFHRGTNMTAPFGHRFALTACFRNAHESGIDFRAWPVHEGKPWNRIFAHATPAQLACFGVHPPGHPFWTEVTLKRAQVRYPDWDLTPYREAMAQT